MAFYLPFLLVKERTCTSAFSLNTLISWSCVTLLCITCKELLIGLQRLQNTWYCCTKGDNMKGNGNIQAENRKTHENVRNGLKKKGDKRCNFQNNNQRSKEADVLSNRCLCWICRRRLKNIILKGAVKSTEYCRETIDPVVFFLVLFLPLPSAFLCWPCWVFLREMPPFASL